MLTLRYICVTGSQPHLQRLNTEEHEEYEIPDKGTCEPFEINLKNARLIPYSAHLKCIGFARTASINNN